MLLSVVFALIACSTADHSDSDSSDDHEDKHSGGVVGVKNNDQKSIKGTKKEKKVEEADEDDEEAHLSDADIDEMFRDKPESTVKPAEGEHIPAETAPPPLGAFGNGYSGLWGGGDDDDKDDTLTEMLARRTTVSPPSSGSGNDNSKDGKDDSPASGNYGSPFYPIPRPIDIWDRLFVLAAFPICFFAVMLKAEMFR